MYNRILKRPMFKRGGPSYSHQGTGITSGLDTPRRGLVQHSGGYAGKTLEEINIEKEQIFQPKPNENINDIIKSFGVYAAPYKADGTAMTTGEMGYEQAKMIDKIRTEREEKQDLAKLSGLESDEAALIREEEHENKLAQIRLEGENLEFRQKIKNERERADKAIAALDPNSATYEADKKNIETEFDNISKQIIRQNPSIQKLIQASKQTIWKTHQAEIQAHNTSYVQTLMEKWNDKNPNKQKTIVDIVNELAIADVTGTTAASAILIQTKAKGGRVGYQMGTPNTGAAPVQEVQATENIMTPTTDITATETVTEGQQASVQMPYEQFRASIPAEVSDEIVQLIYYNQDAFADFAQITTQADVYAFNNKYGVSLVLPMDTETT